MVIQAQDVAFKVGNEDFLIPNAIPVPEHLIDYIDYEAYGRDVRINEGGHFAPGGYVPVKVFHPPRQVDGAGLPAVAQ